VTIVLTVLVVVLALALVAVSVIDLNYRRRRPASKPRAGGARRILFPFVANALSQRALDAALRLASAEDATLVPIFLATVPLHLPLDTPLPRQCAIGIPLQEAIEQRATAFSIPVDARIERGRTYRHALRQTIANERFDRIVIAAATGPRAGFHADDVRWLLENAPGEIVVLRPSEHDVLSPPARLPSRWRRAAASTRPRRERAGAVQ
jgi:hypothetical protein